MIENIKLNLKKWDWRSQSVWEWENKEQISVILSRIDSWYYITKKVELDLQVYDLSSSSFDCPDLFDFLIHYKLVENANLKYPIIINKDWKVVDWRHRICKAILKWHKKIKWIMIMDDSIV